MPTVPRHPLSAANTGEVATTRAMTAQIFFMSSSNVERAFILRGLVGA